MNNVTNALTLSLIQTGLCIGSIIVVGVVIAVINKLFYRLVGSNSYKVCIATGFIGTPIHELGHALMCVIFGHKVVEIKLFDPSPDDGAIGYVKHTYNKKNFYQRMGNFFIGVGPIILGSAVLVGLLRLLLPATFDNTLGVFNSLDAVSLKLMMITMEHSIINFFRGLFSISSLSSWQFWVYFLLASAISLHMKLSGPDIKHGLSGLFFCLLICFSVPFIIGLISTSFFGKYIGFMYSWQSIVISVYALAVAFSCITLVLAFFLKYGVKGGQKLIGLLKKIPLPGK